MKRIMMKTNEVVHSLSVVETLRRRKIGTNSMERLTEKLCGGNDSLIKEGVLEGFLVIWGREKQVLVTKRSQKNQ